MRTVSFFEDLRYEVRLVRVVESGHWELELVRQLHHIQHISPPYHSSQRPVSLNTHPNHIIDIHRLITMHMHLHTPSQDVH